MLMALVMCLSFVGCSKEHDEFYGKWGYVHEPKETVMKFKDNGRVVYNGESYTYTVDENFFNLTAKDGSTLKLRYEMDKENMYIYQTTAYEYVGEGTPDSIIGLWENAQNKWKFEFTTEGTFNEDGYFPGYYAVDEENGVVKLAYNDQFVDTYIYYTLEGTTLTIEYPWLLVKSN